METAGGSALGAALAAAEGAASGGANLSSVFGSISFACYLVLMVPQLVEQWRLKTVEGVSLYFLGIWMLGDVSNLIGAVLAQLLPEVVLIAVWFLLADLITLAFYFYISVFFDRRRREAHHPNIHTYGAVVDDLETGASGASGAAAVVLPVDRRKSHSSTLEDIVYDPQAHSVWVRYVLPIGFVLLAGVFGSILSPNNVDPKFKIAGGNSDSVAQLFGYVSAFLYLVARLPQIYQNWAKQSTEGLSLLFFMLTMLGNITFTLQILTFRSDWEYVRLNMSWLLGSAGTILQDLIIIFQFYKYRTTNR